MKLIGLMAAIAAAAALGLAACGDDSDDSGESGDTDFAAQADAVCIDAAREVADLALARESAPFDEETTVAVYEEINPVQEQALADLEALEPPADVSADYEQYLSLRQDAIDVRQEAIDASRTGDEQGFEVAAADLGELVQEVEGAAERAGLEACANVLPEDDVAAVESTEVDAAAETDPEAFCTEYFLPQGLTQFYGTDDPQKCIDASKSDETAEVEVHEVSGVDGIVAFAVVEFPDEKKASLRGPFEDTLYYVDGEWKIYSSSLVE